MNNVELAAHQSFRPARPRLPTTPHIPGARCSPRGRTAVSCPDNGNLDVSAWTATISFALLGLTVLAILWPRHDWVFTVNASTFIENYVEHPGGSLALPAIHRDLALHMSASYSANADQLRWLFIAFRAGAVLLVAEVGAWVVNLSVGA